jgi:hypothetical protein
MSKINLKDKKIALLIWNTEKEDDAHVYIGQIIQEEAESYFLNASMGWKLNLDPEQISRLTPVTNEMKEILLHSDYFISLSMGVLPDDNNEGYIPTGLKW